MGAFATSAGSSLYFEEFGSSRSGPPVLCLHGIGGGAWFFSGFAKRMAGTHRVICVDLPGTGNSPSGVAPFTLESMARDLGEFVREEIREPVILLGHSFGTILSLKAWETWPRGSIRALLFACGLPKARPNIHERLSARAADIADHGIAGWGPKVSPGVFSKKSLAEKPETIAMFDRLFEDLVPETYTRIIEVLLAADMRAVVPTVAVPCAAIVGSDDSYAPPDAAREFVAGLPVPCPVTVL
ncbi:MAG TPA: alpha/beta hydrolase, partial [Fibrobacteria bacterium]|nr:alpha/beta hydrolase [Fibrobacteria bacterium]